MNKDGNNWLTVLGVVILLILFISYFSNKNEVLTPAKRITRTNESEGIVKYSDCRQKILAKDSDKTNKKFICNYLKTADNSTILSGECVNIETENGICTKAVIYEAEPDVSCGENMFVNVNNGVCQCDVGYKNINNKCEPIRCPVNAFVDPSTNSCACNFNYIMDSSGNCQEVRCSKNAVLNKDDGKCYCSVGFELDLNSGECVAFSCPKNSRLNPETNTCECKQGYNSARSVYECVREFNPSDWE